MSDARGDLVERWEIDVDRGLLEALLTAGGVVAFPTESSYGLGVDPASASGVEAIFRLKGRERGKPLPVVAASFAQLRSLGVVEDSEALAWGLARWPAALTVVVPVAAPVAASAGRAELAVRIPAHAGLRELLARRGGPLTATSANPSGEPPYLEAEAVADWLARERVRAAVVEGGRLPGGPPSTLVGWSERGPVVLRAGRYRVE